MSATRCIWIASLLGGLLGSWVAAPLAHAGKPRVAVMAVAADQLGADVRSKVDAAVAGGLAASGADVVDSVTTSKRIAARGLAGCQTSTCRMAIAEATGARYLMRGQIESMGRSYSVRLEMIDGTTGGVVGIREERCEICTESDMYETASVTASALKAEVGKRGNGGKRDGTDVAGGPPDRGVTGAPTATQDRQPGKGDATGATGNMGNMGNIGSTDGMTLVSSPSNMTSTTPAGQGPAPRWGALSWVGVGAGAVAVGAGIYLLSIDGNGTCPHGPGELCEFSYRTRTGGFTLIGAGAIAAGIGATLLIGRF